MYPRSFRTVILNALLAEKKKKDAGIVNVQTAMNFTELIAEDCYIHCNYFGYGGFAAPC